MTRTNEGLRATVEADTEDAEDDPFEVLEAGRREARLPEDRCEAAEEWVDAEEPLEVWDLRRAGGCYV